MRVRYHPVLAGIFLLGCAGGGAPVDETQRITSSVLAIPQAPTGAASVEAVIELEPATQRWGVNPRTELEEFGLLSGAVIIHDSMVVLADRMKRRVVSLSAGGEIQVVAQTGSGPGEVREPSALLLEADGKLSVLDNALRRSQLFERREGGWAVVATSRTPTNPHAACLHGDRIVGMEFDPFSDRSFFSHDREGSDIKRFGPILVTGSRTLNLVVTGGHLICGREDERIYAAALTGDIMSFDADGEAEWRQRVPGFVPLLFTDYGSSVMSGGVPDSAEAAMQLVSFHRLAPEIALVQYKRYERPPTHGPDVERGIESFVIRLPSGEVQSIQRDLPHILAVSRSMVVTTGVDPEPWVEVRPYRFR